MSLNSPYIGHVKEDTFDNLVVSRKFLVNRSNPLNVDDPIKVRHLPTDRLKSYPVIYTNSLLTKGVKILNEDFVGFIMKETNDKIVVFGNYVQRYDIPKSKIYKVEGKVILNLNLVELLTYEVDNYTSLPK